MGRLGEVSAPPAVRADRDGYPSARQIICKINLQCTVYLEYTAYIIVRRVHGSGSSGVLRRLGRLLAEKWQRAYSQVAGFLNARMSIAILRASSYCLRGPRCKIDGNVCKMEDGAALGVVLGL